MDDFFERQVLIVDDHAMVRSGFRKLLEEHRDARVEGEASSAARAIELATERKFDLAIVDITLERGGASGLQLIKRLRTQDLVPHILAVSMHDEKIYAQRAISSGADGYIMKRASPTDLLHVIDHVLEGEMYVSDEVKKQLLSSVSGLRPEGRSYIDALSDRELEVLRLLGAGYERRHIADKLHLSPKTVGAHRHRIKKKLGLESANEVTRFAIAWRCDHAA